MLGEDVIEHTAMRSKQTAILCDGRPKGALRCQVSCAVPYASLLIGAENSLLALKNSLLGRAGNLACKARKTKGKFDTKIVPNGRFRENSLQNSLQAGNLSGSSAPAYCHRPLSQ
jgi:hypothetical protein